jgi:integrase
MVAGILDTLRPSLLGHHHFLNNLVFTVGKTIVYHLESTVGNQPLVSLPVELSAKSVSTLQEKCRDITRKRTPPEDADKTGQHQSSDYKYIKRKSTLPEYALAYLLQHLRDMQLIHCPTPRIRLDTDRDLAASFHPDEVRLWARMNEWWDQILETMLDSELPKPRIDGANRLRRILHDEACLALLGLIMEGDLFLSHQIAPLTRIRLTDLCIEEGFLQIPWVPRRYKKRSDQNQESTPPGFLTESFWLPPLAHLLLLRYIRMRVLWGRYVGEPLVLGDPRSHIFHEYIRSHPEVFTEWLEDHPVKFRPHRISTDLALVSEKSTNNRSLLGTIITARRAARVTTAGPIFTALRSRLLVTRPPTTESWHKVVLGKRPPKRNPPRTTKQPTPALGPAPQLLLPAPSVAYASPASSTLPLTEEHHRQHDAALDACRAQLQPLQHRVNALLRVIGKATPMGERNILAKRIEELSQELPLLPPTEAYSPSAPLSNFRLQLEWLRDLLTTRQDPLSSVSVRNYYCTIQARLVQTLGARNVLSLITEDDVARVVSSMLDPDLGGNTLKTQRAHFVRIFAFLHFHHGVAVVNLSNKSLWVGSEIHPFPLLSPHEFDALIDGVSQPDNVALILGGYGMVRRGELAGLLINDLIGTANDLHLSIRRSKTRAGIRRVPLWALLPDPHLQTVLAYRASRERAVSPNGMNPFLVDEQGVPFTESQLGDRISNTMRRAGLDVQSLHPLRHQGASWFPLVWYCAFHQLPGNTLGFNFDHPLFKEEHFERFRQLFVSLPQLADGIHHPWDTNPFHVLSRIMGHSNPLTSIQRYVHTLSFLEYLLMQHQKHIPDSLKNIPRTQAARLLVSSPSEISDMYKLSTSRGGKHADKKVPLLDILNALRASLAKGVSTG